MLLTLAVVAPMVLRPVAVTAPLPGTGLGEGDIALTLPTPRHRLAPGHVMVHPTSDATRATMVVVGEAGSEGEEIVRRVVAVLPRLGDVLVAIRPWPVLTLLVALAVMAMKRAGVVKRAPS